MRKVLVVLVAVAVASVMVVASPAGAAKKPGTVEVTVQTKKTTLPDQFAVGRKAAGKACDRGAKKVTVTVRNGSQFLRTKFRCTDDGPVKI